MPAMVEELPPSVILPARFVEGFPLCGRFCRPYRGRISPALGAGRPPIVEESPPCRPLATLGRPPVLREASPADYGGRISPALGDAIIYGGGNSPHKNVPLPPMVEGFPLCATQRERNGGRISPHVVWHGPPFPALRKWESHRRQRCPRPLFRLHCAFSPV